jgi:hypothetical protein
MLYDATVPFHIKVLCYQQQYEGNYYDRNQGTIKNKTLDNEKKILNLTKILSTGKMYVKSHQRRLFVIYEWGAFIKMPTLLQ